VSENDRPASTVVHRGRVITVHRDVISLPDGSTRRRDVVRHPGAVAVIPVLEDGRIVLLRQDRHAIGKTIVEIPAGTLEAGERPIDCARRELAEETGYRAGTIRPLTSFFTAPGFCDEYLHLFEARDLVGGETALEPGERIETRIATPAEARAMIRDGTIEDAKTLVALLMVLDDEEARDD